MIDELPHGIASRSKMRTAAEQLAKPETTNKARGDRAGGVVLDLVEMLSGAQDVVSVVKRLVGRILFRHEAQVVCDVGEVMSCDPVEHVVD